MLWLLLWQLWLIQNWMYEERQRRNGDFWQVRLGIHSGELVAGVIGKTKFAYEV
jgi:adenylate cyclase